MKFEALIVVHLAGVLFPILISNLFKVLEKVKLIILLFSAVLDFLTEVQKFLL